MVEAKVSDNCGACGGEYSNTELIKISLYNWDLKLCANCMNRDTLADYKEAAKMLNPSRHDPLEEYRGVIRMMNRKY